MSRITDKFWLLLIALGCFAASAHADREVPATPEHFCIEGGRYSQVEEGLLVFRRHDPAIFTVPSYMLGFNLPNAQTTSGIVLHFRTDSPFFEFEFDLSAGENRGSDYALYVEGEQVETYRFAKPDKLNRIRYERPAGHSDLIDYRLVLPSWSTPRLVAVTVADAAEWEVPVSERPVYVALGDSISHGVGQASASYLTFPFQIAQALDYELVNLAVGGAKISLPTVEMLRDFERVDLITILIGYNDWNGAGRTPELYGAQYEKMLRSLLESHPEAEIFCISPLYTRTEVSKKSGLPLQPFREIIIAVVSELQTAGYGNLHLIGGDAITSEASLDAQRPTDPVHLGIPGAAALADELISIIQREL